MSKRIRVKRKSAEEDSPISPLMQSYVKAVVRSAIDSIDATDILAQLAALHIQMRICRLIFMDLQSSANLAAASVGSSKATLEELVSNLQSALGVNLSVLDDIQRLGYAEVDLDGLTTMVEGQEQQAADDTIRQVLDGLRAQAQRDRGPEGEDFDDLIENAMDRVDDDVDIGERIRERLEEHDVRGSGGTRQAQRRRRSAS